MPLISKNQIITSGDGKVKESCLVYYPQKLRDLESIILDNNNHIIPTGDNMSGGDAAIQNSGVIKLHSINRVLSFDAEEGVIEAQAGALLLDINNIAVQKNWLLPSLPRNKDITLGAAIACNIFANNQHQHGDFSDSLVSLRLITASGDHINCSKDENSDLFYATINGFGLTGIIESAKIKLLPIKAKHIKTKIIEVVTIEQLLDLLMMFVKESDYIYGWYDLLENKDGPCGFLHSASFVNDNEIENLVAHKKSSKFSALAKLSSKAFNKFWLKSKLEDDHIYTNKITDYFDHKLKPDKMIQYSFLIPDSEDLKQQNTQVFELIKESQVEIYNAIFNVYKASENTSGLLSCQKNGVVIRLNLPPTGSSYQFLQKLDQLIIGFGGHIFLAQDSRLPVDILTQIYDKNLEAWQEIAKRIDPDNRFVSRFSDRLKLK